MVTESPTKTSLKKLEESVREIKPLGKFGGFGDVVDEIKNLKKRSGRLAKRGYGKART